MSKQRKILGLICSAIGLILIAVNVPIIVYGEVNAMPDNWAGYIAMAVVDVVGVCLALILLAIFMPKITKIENEKLIKDNDFNILNLSGNINNVFDVYHSEIIGAEFKTDKVIFKRVKFSVTGSPVLKDEQKVMLKRKVEISDLCTFDMEVPYSDLSFTVVTNRNFWGAVPNIGIAVKFNKSVTDTFMQNDEYAIINASKEVLYYILGNENELKNSELLNEKKLEQKPKLVKKFVFNKIPWWGKLILMLFVYGLCVGLGVLVNAYIAVPLAVIATTILLMGERKARLYFYNEYFSDGVKLCTIKEILKVYKKQFPDNKFSAVAIVTPVFTLMYPFRDDLWKFLQNAIPNKISND